MLWLRSVLRGEEPWQHRPVEGAVSIEVTRASYGLERRHAERFRAALDGATYLDYCDSIPYVREHVGELGIQRAPGLYRNASPETSNIVFEWTYYEMRGYLARHRCLIAGAEAGLLRELCRSDRNTARSPRRFCRRTPSCIFTRCATTGAITRRNST